MGKKNHAPFQRQRFTTSFYDALVLQSVLDWVLNWPELVPHSPAHILVVTFRESTEKLLVRPQRFCGYSSFEQPCSVKTHIWRFVIQPFECELKIEGLIKLIHHGE